MEHEFDLFDMLGIPRETVETKKPATKKTAEKKPAKKDAKKPAEKTWNSPLKVYIGAVPEVFVLESAEVIKEKDILSFAAEKVPSYVAENTKFVEIDKDHVLVTYKPFGKAKGSISVKENCRMLYGTTEIDVSTVLQEGLTIDTDKLSACLQEVIPFKGTASFLYSGISNIISVEITGNSMENVPMPEKDLFLHTENGEILSIPVSVLMNVENSESDTEDTESSQPAELPKDVPVLLEKWLPSETYHKHMRIISTEETDHYFLVCESISTLSSAANASTKETKWCVDDVELSLLFKAYHLTKDMFDGKDEVQTKDIIRFLIDHGHREFTWQDEKSVAIEWNKKNRMLLVTLKGSRKGAADAAPFPFPGKKLSATLMYEWLLISRTVCKELASECLLDLYYDPREEKYLWLVPEQVVSEASVRASFESLFQSYKLCGLVKVGQFHSHAAFPAFFSSIDDADEVMPGLYGVIGRMDRSMLLEERILQESEGYFSFRQIMEDGRIRHLTFSDVFEEIDINVIDADELSEFQSFLKRIHKMSDLEYPQEGYKAGTFENGTRALYLSCAGEASFVKHSTSFSVVSLRYPFNDETVYVAVGAEEPVPDGCDASDLKIEPTRQSFFSLY